MVGFFTDPENGAKMALVQEVNFQTENQRQRDSQLFRHWTLRSKENRTTKRHDAVLAALPLEVLSDRLTRMSESQNRNVVSRENCHCQGR
jgi:hypothetical protein